MSKKGGQKPGLEQPNGKPAAKASPANAWNRPLKARTPGPPPGMGPPSKPNAQSSNDVETSSILRDRLLHLALTLVGQSVVLTQTNGGVLEGVFHTFTPFPSLKAELKNKYALKAVRVTKPPTNGEKPVEDGSTVVIPVEKVVYVHAKNVSLDRPAANGAGFTAPDAKNDVITDTQISGSKNDKNHDLVSAGSAWTTGGKGGGDLGGSLDDNKGGMTRAAFGTARTQGGLKGAIGQWDQFKANEELFNVQASYDENLYTTELDKSQIDAKKLAEAERLAKEIEGTTSTNIHIAEERGQAIETDFDEEDRYSGVLTKDGKQRHDATKAAAPKMNYAAAAAKAEPAKKPVPPGFVKTEKPAGDKAKAESTTADAPAEADEKKETPAEEKDAKVKEEKPVEKEEDKGKTEETKKTSETKKEESKDGEAEKEKPKSKSKLNANAKAFTFNPSAKSFTPGGGSNFAAPATQPQHADPNAQMHAPPMQPPHYMHPGPMGQPGMMPMMNPQFQGMRYAPQYQSMDPQMAPMQTPQPQHAEPAPAATPAGEEAVAAGEPAPAKAGEGESGSQQQQPDDSSQQSAPQQQFQMQYNVPPPQAYYGAGGMQMHPRGPQYPGQFVGNPQQMPVVPAGTRGYPVYPMQPGGMPPNMHMRGPNGNPYYGGPGAPPGPYGGGSYGGHGMMEDSDPNFRGRGGRGPGRGGRGRRNGRGRGRGGYNSGRGSSHQNQGSNDSTANGNDTKQQSTDGGK
eukprot:CAMPEP_0113635842 /NCGR_PEP_ID=MMETSP0017_2-20120614/18689_1 /TAXON_ID=2856 /ORGANISM="Cylindrotheca closterium" /LENGTH=739 /DNA_ID=CAMNT_0000546651 /DNA_START=45 /DNA_END=2264 /DNA_ORIENTATION=+ /assembly_acc=CAM_ASM_000147